MRRTWLALVLCGVVAVPGEEASAVMGWLAVGAGGPPLPAPGLDMVPVMSRLATAEFRLPGETEPEPVVTLTGVVVDHEDRPIPGALVRVMYWLYGEPVGMRGEEILMLETEGPDGDSGHREAEAVTGDDGTFSIPGLPPGMSVDLDVVRRGFMWAGIDDIEVPAAEPVRVVLAPGSRIAGRVLDTAGKPVPEARVGLYRPGAQSTERNDRRLPYPVDGYAEEDGTFVLEPVEPGRARLGASAPGFLPADLRIVELPAGQGLENVELVLRRGAVVTGRVTGRDGEPLRYVQVKLIEDSAFWIPGVSTDEEGRYRLEGLPEGLQSFVATGRSVQRAVRELEVRQGENRLDFRVEASHVVSGRVVDASGKPLENAVVGLAAPGGMVVWDRVGTRTYVGSGGAFQLEGVETGVYDVQAASPGYSPARLERVEVTGPVEGLVLRLGPEASVHGRLVGLDAEGLAGAGVAALSLGTEGINTLSAGSDVNARGEYRIGNLAAGDWEIIAGTSSGANVRRRVTLSPGADLELDLKFGSVTLTGRVLRGGEAVEDALVTAEALGRGTWHGQGFTDRQGTVRFPNLMPGVYLLNITSPLGSRHEQRVELSEDREVVVDITGQTVSGQVVDAEDRSPLDLVPVFLKPAETIRPSGSPSMWTRSDETGAFTLTNVAPGTYRLGARLDGYVPAETKVEVGKAGVDGLSLALQKAEGLVVEVLGPFGRPPASVEVALVDATGRAVVAGSHSTGENGRVRITSAPAGSWRLVVSAPGCATVEQTVEVPGPPVRLALPHPSALTVSALWLDRWATVTLTGEGGQPFRSVEHGQLQQEWRLWTGRALIYDLPEGRWQVRVTAPDGRTWQEEVVTTVGSPARMVIPEEAPDQPAAPPPTH